MEFGIEGIYYHWHANLNVLYLDKRNPGRSEVKVDVIELGRL